MAIVETVKKSLDGKVRSCEVSYRIPYAKDATCEYSGGKQIKISRSVQRLTLLLPVEEQLVKLDVDDGIVKETVKAQNSLSQ